MRWFILLLTTSCIHTAHREQLLERGFSECEAECIEDNWRLMRLKYECPDHFDLYVGVRDCFKRNHEAIIDWARMSFSCKCGD